VSRFYGLSCGFCALGVPFETLFSVFFSPTSVTVHNDGNVLWDIILV
jgi:hypothetical protein